MNSGDRHFNAARSDFVKSTDGARLHVRRLGDEQAPAVILLHGFLLDHSMWLDVSQMIARHQHVILPDLRGHGLSESTSGDVSMKTLANDLRHVADVYAPGASVVVGGHSMGGIVVMELVRQCPALARGLILCGARPNAESDAGRAWWETLIERAKAIGPSAAIEAFRSVVFSESFDQAERERWFERMASISVSGLTASARALADRPDQWATLRAFSAPALLLFGEDDRATPPALGLEMKGAMKHARLNVIAGAGHVPPVERAHETAAAIKAFLRER